MEIKIDLKRIKSLAQRRDDENWEFRSFLKQIDLGMEELDEVVHRIVTDVTSEIDCTQCANCCRMTEPVLDEDDVTEFCSGLKTAVLEFKDEFLIQDEESSKYRFREQPCAFLNGNLCSNYDHRPKDCRSYPHLHKPEFATRLFGVLENYAVCPIVFNSYEWLKAELWHDNDWDDGLWI